MKRTLHLRREALAELTTDDLGGVHGGEREISPLEACPTFRACPTMPITGCIETMCYCP